MPAVAFEAVDIVFGDKPADRAAAARRRAQPREQILAETGQVLGVAGCTPHRRARRDLRADGPLGLGQVDPAARRQRAQQGRARLGPGRRRGQPDRRRQLRRRRPCAACACTASPWCSSSSRSCPGARSPRTWPSASSCAACPRPSATGSSWRSWRWSIWRSGPASSRTSSRAACSSGSASPAPSPPTPTSCSWTSRSRPSTR